MEKTKRCPYCGEEILAIAKKCKHCGEWLDETHPLKETKNAPACGESIAEPTLKSKACLKCLYFTIIIFDLCRYLEYFSYLYTINQTE